MNFKVVSGIYLPENEEHLIRFLEHSGKHGPINGRGHYQIHTLSRLINYVDVDDRNCVLDIGGHVGLWSIYLSRFFQKVIAYEPVPFLQECFLRNTIEHPQYPLSNVDLRPYGLGETACQLDVVFDTSNSGHTHVKAASETPEATQLVRVNIRRLDDEAFDVISAIKIDVEGFEHSVINGAVETILKHKPVICIEQKPHNFHVEDKMTAVKTLVSWGARVVEKVVDDYILVWD